MNALNNNIKFNYLYRDAGNYKEFGEVTFTNTHFATLDKIERSIRENLIEGEFFVPEKWEIPRLSFSDYSPDLDHEYHEFEGLEFTDEDATESVDISIFLNRISEHKTK